MSTSTHIKLWDLPTRLFHWLLAIGIAAAWGTGELGGIWMIWHTRIGLFILGLISFRICWGFVGSTYARFSTFVHGPSQIIAYLRGQWHGLGHNPLGALSVIGLLVLVLLQSLSGLFAYNDDLGIGGPLYPLLSSSFSAISTKIHNQIFNVLLALIGLHIAAILFYTHYKKEKLLKPMLTGWKEHSETHLSLKTSPSAQGGGPLALLCALAVTALLIYVASGIWLPAPTPLATPAPAW